MEGTTVNLICSAEAPCPKQPPTISWSNISESALITTQLQEKPDNTQSVFSYMTYKASYKDHRKNITCTATYTRNITQLWKPPWRLKSYVRILELFCNLTSIIMFRCVLLWCLVYLQMVLLPFKFLQKRLTSPSSHLIQSLLVLMWLWPAKAKPVQMKLTTPGTNIIGERAGFWRTTDL